MTQNKPTSKKELAMAMKVAIVADRLTDIMIGRVTQKDVREYLRRSAQNWHDNEWHQYMKNPKTLKIAYAIYNNGKSPFSIAEITRACNEN